MKKAKRCLSLILALAMALGLAVVPVGAVETNAYQLYLDQLHAVSSDLHVGKPIAFVDICGDEMPEMLYVTRTTVTEHYWYGDYTTESGVLHAVTFRDNALAEVLLQEVDFGRNEAMGNYLGVWAAKNTVALCDSSSTDDVFSDNYIVFQYNKREFTKSECFSIFGDPFHVSGMEGGNEDGIHFLYGEGFPEEQTEITEEEFDSYYAQIEALGDPIIEISVVGWDGFEFAKDPIGMDLSQAEAYLQDKIASGSSDPSPTSSGFSDVKESAWYAGDVADIQKYGLINGHPDGTFRPQEKLTLAQAITLAARTHAQLNGGAEIKNGSPWYVPYVDYADANGICQTGEFGTDYNSECSRLAMAVLFQRAFPTDTEQVLNDITALPDVEDEGYGSSVFYLYRQGVLTGNDSAGTFKPDKSVSRAEAAAILNRVMDAEKRKSFTLETSESPSTQPGSETEEIYDGYKILLQETFRAITTETSADEWSYLLESFFDRVDYTSSGGETGTQFALADLDGDGEDELLMSGTSDKVDIAYTPAEGGGVDIVPDDAARSGFDKVKDSLTWYYIISDLDLYRDSWIYEQSPEDMLQIYNTDY